MNPLPDTPARFSAVPGHTRLFRREPGGTYYLRAKVPELLRPIINKTEIRKSLRTKDYKEGLLRVKPESIRVDRLFMEAEAEIKGQKPAPAKLSREELAWLVSDWFVKQESQSDQWIKQELPLLDEERYFDLFPEDQEAQKKHAEEKRKLLDGLRADSNALAENFAYTGSDLLDEFLRGDGFHLKIENGSEDYQRLLPQFQMAQLEILARRIDRIMGADPTMYNPLFKNLNANTILPPPPKAQVELGKFLDEFMAYQKKEHSETTPAAYALIVRILREVAGEKTPLNAISPQHIKKVCDVLRSIPVNMTQRYPGLSAERAIAAAARANDTRKLAPRTLRNNYILLVAIFNYAVEDQLISSNPAKVKHIGKEFKTSKKPKAKRELFSPEELQKIFHAPLYTGCMNDERGYAKPGTEHPRRGRFWVPLLALFQGLRCNEACQLYLADFGVEKGISYLNVREDLDDEEETEKRVKNVASWRKVPIHPEILKMGFLEYIEAIRKSGECRLFPTLHPCKLTGRYSKPFSKWFSSFKEKACGYGPKGVFHSFRHHFRSQLEKAGVQTSYVEALGGWKPEGSSEIEYRHAELPVLRAAIEKIAYPGLDLSHLYAARADAPASAPEDDQGYRIRIRRKTL